MPVIVVGAQTSTGWATVRRLLASGGEVRAFVDLERAGEEEAEQLRRRGCQVALGALDDEGHIEMALEGAHTVVHLAHGPVDDPRTTLDALATTCAAFVGAGCRRLVWSSHLGADAPRDNAFLETCAEGEAMVADLPAESVSLRAALTYGPGDPASACVAAGGGSVADAQQVRHAPVYVDDLAAAVASADADRQAGELDLVAPLVGPEVTTLSAFAERLAAAGPWTPCHPPRHLDDLLGRDGVAPPGTPAVGAVGLDEGLARIAAAE
jgi:uncharacterized protein YbjT (DUF2867 family)